MYPDNRLWPRWYQTRTTQADHLMRGVAREFDITPDIIRGHARDSELMGPRTVVARVLRERGLSLSVIGRLMSRDHSSVMNCIQNYPIYAKRDPRVDRAYIRWRAA